jgi:2-polyprenyl-3-methyl-5-hydroxy-6-metoxy-1,4-benzoquinol methylase
MAMNNYLQEITDCEVCGNSTLESVLDLGAHPMCDDLVQVNQDRICHEYPIEILFCNVCQTAHQRFQVPKELLFPQTYHYRSRHTADVIDGMKKLVTTCASKLGNLSGKKVLDVGCNDGSLLKIFQQEGSNTYGIEPTGAYSDARQAGITVVHDYLTEEVAKKFIADYGHPDLIVFTNVFAHIENLNQLLASLQILKGPSTCIMIENHYLGSIFASKQFDTFYHEHPRTYSYASFVKIAENLGMEIGMVEFPSRYGGNIRVFIQPLTGISINHHRLDELTDAEKHFRGQFNDLKNQIELWKVNKSAEIASAVKLYGPLVAKAFPGRAAIPIKMLGLDSTSILGVYEKPTSGKIGHYVPGTRIPIYSDESLLLDRPNGSPILNLAWHIQDEIKTYMHQAGFDGDFIQII